jgi:hypothetical protein
VGNHYEQYYYPHMSGTAQSYNYYPVAHMEPKDGLAVVALGLGRYVVEGEKAWRFSPKYPTIQNSTDKDQFKTSQVQFYAADLKQSNLNLLEGEDEGISKLDISVAEKHGTLKHLASVYDPNNDIISAGLGSAGPRILNFANILQYDYTPLAKTLEVLLDVIQEAIGTPVELEYAVDLNKDANYRASFYLLQIKPMVGNEDNHKVKLDEVSPEETILYAEKSLGNGLIDTIEDVIFIDPKRFDKLKTEEMAEEIMKINDFMRAEDRNFVLIGPGRWGTRDRFIGIPVKWPQISRAKIIVETELEGFPLDASLGSHFFHNVTSMNVGYFSIHEGGKNFINYELLHQQKMIQDLVFFKHVRFESPLEIVMDGKKRKALIKMGNSTGTPTKMTD